MIKSMTGFGRCEAVTDECKISVEIKAVNHRYLDTSIKMPKEIQLFRGGDADPLKVISRGARSMCLLPTRIIRRTRFP